MTNHDPIKTYILAIFRIPSLELMDPLSPICVGPEDVEQTTINCTPGISIIPKQICDEVKTIIRKRKIYGSIKQVEMKRFRSTNYYISKDGDVYNEKKRKFLKAYADGFGYRHVTLQGETYRLHRLIYGVWTGKIPPVVHHVDGDSTNNSLNNLEGLSHMEHTRKHLQAKRKSGLY